MPAMAQETTPAAMRQPQAPRGQRPRNRMNSSSSPSMSRCSRERQEVTVQRFGCGAILILPDEEIAHDLAGPAEFSTTPAEPRVGDRQIHELEEASESRLLARTITARSGSQRARYFTARIPELLHECQGMPAATCEIGVEGHSGTSSVTIALMSACVVGSSTLRLGLPRAGRTLIIESNSIQSCEESAG